MSNLWAVTVALAAVLALSASTALANPTEYEEGGATQAIGGVLNTSDGRLTYWAPADGYWFSTEQRIRFFKPGVANLPAKPEGTVWIGDPFRLELRSWPDLTMFTWRKPAQITIHYSPEELGGRPESSLRIVRYFDSWVLLPAVIDTAAHTVTTNQPWGGDYGLVAYDGEPPAMPAPAESGTTAAPASQAASGGSTITGRIYHDKNGDGTFDGDDAPVPSAGIRVGNGSWDGITSTGSDGVYLFSGLAAGTYMLDLVVGAEWDSTTPASVAGLVVTGEPDSKASADFGLTYKSWYTPLQATYEATQGRRHQWPLAQSPF